MMRAFTPIVKPHGRIVNVAANNGNLSRLASPELRERFSNPSLTESELLSLMDEFISDVEQGKHRGKWCSTFYSSSKVGEIAMAMIYAREMAKTGIIINIIYTNAVLGTSFSGYSRASDNGPSEKRTTSLQRTSAVLPIDFSIVIVH